ncbi:ORF44 [Betabaculovirus altermyunipunctae]|uniref:ORF44 n=1 Tax=Betabaculovirus altermyunipunctae TaxID=3051996 RepID=A0A1S5YDX6_9BBAC|nr:ORF44 [Betabaculovirus altermyunipunctae]AQQ80311.1 ORF44 [Betabaculovirus altermyunipunctae]
MDDFSQNLLASFQRWSDSERLVLSGRDEIGLLYEVNGIVSDFLYKKLVQFRRLRHINRVFEEAQSLDADDDKDDTAVVVVTFDV